jgi:hypothetical protein
VACTELALAHRLLRNEPPFSPLHARTFLFQDVGDGMVDDADVLALVARIPSHAHLRRLNFIFLPLNAAATLDALVDAALAQQLSSVSLQGCNLSPASAPALVRLVGGGALAELAICGSRQQLLDVPGALALGNALRASSTLTAVSLNWVDLWLDPAIGMALLGALTGHLSLRSLNISSNQVGQAGRDQAGAVIAALVAADAPALHELDVSSCQLGDEGLRPLFAALPANTHLRTLNCEGNEFSDAFLRDTLLPAVRDNASLQELDVGNELAAAVEDFVRRRADAE